MLTLQRRHSPNCPDRTKGGLYVKCRGRCRLWAIGEGTDRLRFSLKTRDLQKATKRLTAEIEKIEAGGCPPKARKTLADAIASFHAQHRENADETKRKYARVLGFLAAFCAERGAVHIDEANIEMLDAYRLWRDKAGWTWLKEVEILKGFFAFSVEREWIPKNPALGLKRPKNLEANSIEAYTRDEVASIIAACDGIGRTPYERLRARGMVYILRFTALRLSDLVTLSRDHVQGNYIVKPTIKSKGKKTVKIEILPELRQALDTVPRPRGAAQDSKSFFASGSATLRTEVKKAWRTLRAVFKRSGVEGAHPHRFRHTLASEILGRGGTIEDACRVLGDSPAIVRRHYAKDIPEAQIRQDAKLREIHGTILTQAKETVKTC